MLHFVYDGLYVAGPDDTAALADWDGAILCLGTGECPREARILALDVLPDEVIDAQTLEAGVAFMDRQLQARRVLVYAEAGTMFAAVFPVAYLVACHGKSLPDAFVSVSNHVALWPAPFPWLQAVVDVYDLPFSEDEVWDEFLPMQMAVRATQALHPVQNGIYLGSIHTLVNARDTLAEGIDAVLRVDNNPRHQGQWARDSVTLLDLPVPDAHEIAPELLDQAVAFISEQVNAGRRVLVHCQEGVSRSVTMVLAYLIAQRGLTLAQAFRRVVYARPVAHPHPSLLWSLVQRYDLPYTQAEVNHPLFLRALVAGKAP